MLVDIARQIDLDPTIVADLLATDADVVTIRAEEKFFRELGVGGVPTFIANRQFAAQGAETAEKLARFIRHAADHPPQAA